MKSLNTDRDLLMDALLRQHAKGGPDEAFLAELESSIDGKEGAATEGIPRRKFSRTTLAWAALLVASAAVILGVAHHIAKDPTTNNPVMTKQGGVPESAPPAEWTERVQPMRLRVEEVASRHDQTPTRISFTYLAGGRHVSDFFERGASWPDAGSPEGAAFPFHPETIPGGRPGLTVHVARLAAYLRAAGADSPAVNNSLYVTLNSLENGNIAEPRIPSLATDLGLILRDAQDLTAFSDGFTFVTLMRTYFANDVNTVPRETTPAGEAVYPQFAFFAPEEQFGVKAAPVEIMLEGLLNYLPKDGGEPSPIALNRLAARTVDSRTTLGPHSDDTSWRGVSIQGGVFAARPAADRNVVTEPGDPHVPVGNLSVNPTFVQTGTHPNLQWRILPIPARIVGEAPAGNELRGPVARERYGQLVDQPWKTPWQAPLSTFSVDVDTASYTNIRRMLRDGSSVPKDAVRLEECLNYFDYGYAPPVRGGPFTVHVDLATCPWQERHLLAKIGIKGREVNNNNRPPSNLVFLIDVSGSMNSPDKLPLLVESMKTLVEELDERDTVGIVVYAGSAGTLLEPTRVEGEDRKRIVAALDRLSAGGSTAGAAGIRGAYELAARQYRKDGVNRVILATDGDFNVGTSSQGALVDLVKEQAKSGVFLSVLGFGTGNLNDGMMEAITNDGNGKYFYIDSKREGRKVFLQNLSGTLVTIAKDVKLQVEFNPAKVAAYRLIGYANRILRDEDFNDDKVDAGDIGAGHTVTALYEIIPVGVELPAVGGVDPLKYQAPAGRNASDSPEWMTVKLRYKKPDGDQSSLLTVPVAAEPTDWRQASPDYVFAAAVALFGEKLRESDKINGASWQDLGVLVMRGTGTDRHGHRSEFLELVGLAAARHPDQVPGDVPQANPDRSGAVEAPPAE
jgi:Ca-activated chloride channel family protein